MKINSQAIYETKPLASYQEGKWCFTQSKDGKTRLSGICIPIAIGIEIATQQIGTDCLVSGSFIAKMNI
jgi:hypothetical protein